MVRSQKKKSCFEGRLWVIWQLKQLLAWGQSNSTSDRVFSWKWTSQVQSFPSVAFHMVPLTIRNLPGLIYEGRAESNPWAPAFAAPNKQIQTKQNTEKQNTEKLFWEIKSSLEIFAYAEKRGRGHKTLPHQQSFPFFFLYSLLYFSFLLYFFLSSSSLLWLLLVILLLLGAFIFLFLVAAILFFLCPHPAEPYNLNHPILPHDLRGKIKMTGSRTKQPYEHCVELKNDRLKHQT